MVLEAGFNLKRKSQEIKYRGLTWFWMKRKRISLDLIRRPADIKMRWGAKGNHQRRDAGAASRWISPPRSGLEETSCLAYGLTADGWVVQILGELVSLLYVAGRFGRCCPAAQPRRVHALKFRGNLALTCSTNPARNLPLTDIQLLREKYTCGQLPSFGQSSTSRGCLVPTSISQRMSVY
jgi:hypothetical protein